MLAKIKQHLLIRAVNLLFASLSWIRNERVLDGPIPLLPFWQKSWQKRTTT
jgi:hypothetical protein